MQPKKLIDASGNCNIFGITLQYLDIHVRMLLKRVSTFFPELLKPHNHTAGEIYA